MYYNENMYTNSKFQSQFSRKLQRFRTCRKYKKCSIFHDLFEYIICSYDCILLDWSFNAHCPIYETEISEAHSSLILKPKLKIRVLGGIQILNQFQKIANFNRDYLDNGNDSEFTVKTKNT